MKYASLLVICLSLVAGKASAAIPDASGVYHGCYNLLTGSLRVIDGTNCGLLERHVAWQQTGLPGPVGPQGPQGPAGPAGSNAHVIIGFGTLTSITDDPQTPNNFNKTFLPADTAFTAAADGKCNVAFSAWLVDPDLPRVEMFPTYLENETEHMGVVQRANLSTASDTSLMQGASTYGFNIVAGSTYLFGVSLLSPDFVLFHAISGASINWTCVYDDE